MSHCDKSRNQAVRKYGWVWVLTKTSRLSSLWTHIAQGRAQGYIWAKLTNLDRTDMAANTISCSTRLTFGVCNVHTNRRTHHDWSALEYFHFLSEIPECLRDNKVKFKNNTFFFRTSNLGSKAIHTFWASISDWNVMYQLLLCANSVLNTLGQFSFLKRASTSCEIDTSHTITITNQAVLPIHDSNFRSIPKCGDL